MASLGASACLCTDRWAGKALMPQFAHLPLLLKPDEMKLSKRDGDR